jgi:hypothetical protein
LFTLGRFFENCIISPYYEQLSSSVKVTYLLILTNKVLRYFLAIFLQTQLVTLFLNLSRNLIFRGYPMDHAENEIAKGSWSFFVATVSK